MATSKLSRILDHIGPTADPQSPLLVFRLSPIIGIASVLLALTLWKTGFAHRICLEVAAMQLATLAVASFQITAVTTRRDPNDPSIQQLHLGKGC